MTKITTTLVAATLCAALSLHSFKAEAQASTDLHLGIGLGATFAGGLPVGASIDFPITDDISVGGLFAYQRWGQRFLADEFSYTILTFGARGAYHLSLDELPAELDPYGGVMLAFQSVRVNGFEDTFGFNPLGNRFYPGIFVGANYNFSERLGAFAELGYSVAYLTVGLNVNL